MSGFKPVGPANIFINNNYFGSFSCSKENWITVSEFKKQMQNICNRNSRDPETLHVEADALMKMVLRQFGYDDGIDLLEEQNIWYS